MILSELLLQKDLKSAEKLMVFDLIAQLQTAGIAVPFLPGLICCNTLTAFCCV
jgi:hypothetical protein